MRCFFVLIHLLVALAQECAWDSPLGKFDFSSHMEFGTMGPVMDPLSGLEAYMTICDEGTQTCTQGTAMTSKFSGTFCIGALGHWATPTWDLVDPTDKAGGVKMSFQNGDECFGAVEVAASKTTIIFECDPDAVGDTFTTESENFNCDFTFHVKSAAACGVGGGGGGGAGGLSGGWVFVIIVLVTFTVYMLVGFLYKTRVKGTGGVESIPNIEFWRRMPSLVKDGADYSWGVIRGPNYQKMGDGPAETTSSGF